jgi:hypothetical protein
MIAVSWFRVEHLVSARPKFYGFPVTWMVKGTEETVTKTASAPALFKIRGGSTDFEVSQSQGGVPSSNPHFLFL